jgi:hypothetical protein
MEVFLKRILPVLFAVFTFVNTVLPAQDFTAYLQQGRKHYAAGELNAAIENFEAAKRLEPEIPTIWKELDGVRHTIIKATMRRL